MEKQQIGAGHMQQHHIEMMLIMEGMEKLARDLTAIADGFLGSEPSTSPETGAEADPRCHLEAMGRQQRILSEIAGSFQVSIDRLRTL